MIADQTLTADGRGKRRLAIVTTHPIQYYAPWFRQIARQTDLKLRVFYLWNPAATSLLDPGFGRQVEWNIPLLEGYDYEFVRNVSRSPGSASFYGIDNPDLLPRLSTFNPAAALLIGYRYRTLQQLIVSPARGFPLLLRGDSHRLAGTTRNWCEPLRRIIVGRIFRRFAAMLYVGKANYDYYRIHGVADDRLFFSPHAVDNDFFTTSDQIAQDARTWKGELGIPPESLLVLFAGKFEEKKRPLDLLQAFSRLEQRNVALLFTGNGALEPALRTTARQMSRVFFAPFQNQRLMPRTYAAADVVVLPSYGKHETWGLAINEALCAARAVIVSDHVGSGPDLVVPNRNGWIFQAGNIASLARQLGEALSDKERLIRYGEEGRKIVARYDYARATTGLQQALDYVALSSNRIANLTK